MGKFKLKKALENTERKSYQPRILYSAIVSLKNEGEIKTSSDIQKLKDSITSAFAAPEIIKEALQTEGT